MIQKLEDFRADWEGRRLCYGLFDCAIMASAWCEIISGENPMSDWPKYDSLRSARDSLKKMKFKDFEAAITSKLEPLENVYFAKEGDIVAVKSQFKNMPALGIFLAPHAILAFGVITDIDGKIIEGSEQVRRVGHDFVTGKAWRVKCQP